MNALTEIAQRAKAAPQHIVLAEGTDPRIIEAGKRAEADGLARITCVTDPKSSPQFDTYVDVFEQVRAKKGITRDQAAAAMADPVFFGMMMVRQGDADGAIAGAVHATSHVMRAALQVIGAKQRGATVSSFFLMVFPDDHPALQGPVVFSDCGLVIDPSSTELADIAAAASGSLSVLTALEPAVAMLSFSTAGSVNHPAANKVAEATAEVRKRLPALNIGGEYQFDAALLPDIRASKAPEGTLQGLPNVFVFPNLDAGNIGYKLAQRLGGAVAIGPITQGLAKPANDLSRGCTVDDVYHLIAVTSVQAQQSAG